MVTVVITVTMPFCRNESKCANDKIKPSCSNSTVVKVLLTNSSGGVNITDDCNVMVAVMIK